MATLLTLFLAFGLGLDPRNAGPLGPGLPPILIGISSAVTVFGGAIARPGYLGACTFSCEVQNPDLETLC